jgi:predicted nucleic acid-binding protein
LAIRGATPSSFSRLRDSASHIWIGDGSSRACRFNAGLTVMGLLGVLVQAKQQGLVSEVRPVLDELIRTARFWIGPELYREVLTQLGEA